MQDGSQAEWPDLATRTTQGFSHLTATTPPRARRVGNPERAHNPGELARRIVHRRPLHVHPPNASIFAAQLEIERCRFASLPRRQKPLRLVQILWEYIEERVFSKESR